MSPPIRRRAADTHGGPVSWRNDPMPENRALVVIITSLQLLLVVAVWLLTIIPAGLLALGVMAWKAIRGERGGRR